ncbi:MAG TPA: transposase [Trebonia sp.]|jgi:transposase|nr:transposase [Trebonia sp.]
MAKGYLPVDRDQPFLLPPDMREWLPAGHAVWLVIEAVRRMDTSAFHARRKTGGAGAAGFDPDMLLTLLVWAYANGVASSRRIEALCGQDVAFRVICAGRAPDHVTIARFRQQFADTAAGLFAQVLVLCARLGMGQVGVVAIDGTKIGASASRDANRTEEGLRRLAADLAARHARADAAEDALFGEGRRGDDDPGDPFTRAERVAAALAGLEAERAAREEAERDRAAREAGTAQAVRGGAAAPPGRRRDRVALAEARLARETAAYQAKTAARREAAAGGRPRGGMPPVPAGEYCRVRQARAALERARARDAGRARAAAAGAGKKGGEPARRNVTDPASRLMPVRGGGFIQGYNPQNVTSADDLVIATRLVNSPSDVLFYQDMIAAAQAAAAMMAAAGGPGDGKIGLALADAGYLSEANLACPGPDRLIATGKRRALEKGARAARGEPGAPEQDQGPIAAMTARLAAEDGIAAYRRRSHIGETFHGDLKHNMGIRRLSVRGLPRASGEWTFAAAVRNLRKAITSGHLTTAALAALPA